MRARSSSQRGIAIGVSSWWLGSIIALAACGELPRPPRARAGAQTERAPELWLFADAQLNNVAGARTRSRTGYLDNYAEHAIRPPSVDLWSGHLLAAAKQHMEQKRLPAFFLGDAANTSCVGEMRRFLRTLQGVTWFGVLGNHDGYYMGNLTFAADAITNPANYTWQGACEHEDTAGAQAVIATIANLEKQLLGQQRSNAQQGTMTKTVAIWLFLDDLHRRASLSPPPLDAANWHVDGEHLVYEGQGHDADLHVHVVAAISSNKGASDTESRSWQGYLLQDVALPRGDHAILLDTTDYKEQPPSDFWSRLIATLFEPHRMPGRWGRIGAHQARKALAMRPSNKTSRFFLMGHHHWARTDIDEARTELQQLFVDPRFATYVSGHTHAPTAGRGTAASEQWELNVTSLTDWPMQIAHVAYWGEPGYVDLRVDPVPVTPTPGACIYAREAADELDYGTVDKYVVRALHVYQHILEYAQHHAPASTSTAARAGALCMDVGPPCIARRLQRTRLATLAGIPDKARREVLAEAIAYDRQVLQTLPEIVRAETDCAVWASELEGDKNGMRIRPNHDIDAAGAALRVRTNPFREASQKSASGASPTYGP